jgi:hypothetical protein
MMLFAAWIKGKVYILQKGYYFGFVTKNPVDLYADRFKKLAVYISYRRNNNAMF